MRASRPGPAALKEWAAVEALLAAGTVSLLVRKGGLVERRDGFEVEHRTFWLFPTQYHQDPPGLRPELGWAIEAGRASRPRGGRLPLRLRLSVAAAWRIEEEALLGEIAPHQPYSDDTLHARFRYRNRPYLHALLVRAEALPAPHLVLRRPSYRGCLSWVPLEEDVPASGARTVLDGPAFAGRAEALGRILSRRGAVRL